MKGVKKSTLVWTLAAFSICFVALFSTGSAVFDRLTVNGQLRNSSNDILTGSYNFSFNIYDQKTGGTPLYQKNITNVTVDANGLYSVTLTGIDLPFDTDYYMGIFINDGPEMSPRLNITDAGTAFRSNRTEYLGKQKTSYYLNTTTQMQTIGDNLTVVDSVFVGSGGYSGGGITGEGQGNLYISGNMYISGAMIPVNDLGINGSNVPKLDDYFTLGNVTNTWESVYIGTGGLYSYHDISSFSGSEYTNISAGGGLDTTGNVSAAILVASTGISMGGDYRTSWPKGQGNTSGEIWAVVDNGTFIKLTGGTMTGNLIVNADLTVDSTDLFVDSTLGRVGIGTASPFQELEAIGDLNITGNAYIGSGGLCVDTDGTCTPQAGNVSALSIIASTGISLGGDYITVWPTPTSGNTTAEIRSAVNSSDTWLSSLGIGTSNTSHKLHLDGGNFLQATANPVHAGSIDDDDNKLLNGSWTIRVSGKYAYLVSSEESGFSIIDISDPANPSVVGNITDDGDTLLNGPRGLYVAGKYAYVAVYVEDGVTIIDVSDPTNPVEVGNITDDATTALDGPYSIYVSGKYAYVACLEGDSFSIIDISDPTNPVEVGNITDDATTELDAPRGVYVSGSYAYVTSWIDDSLSIIDISDPSNPSVVGDIIDDGSKALDGAWKVYVSGMYAYVAARQEPGVSVIDVSDPTNPVEVGNITDDGNSELDGPRSIYVSGKYAYVAAREDNGTSIIDISDPTNPVEVGNITDDATTELAGPYSIVVSGKYAYVAAADDDGIEILDISGIDTPAATIGDLAVGTLDVWENLGVANDLYVGSGAVVGSGGILSQGPLSVSSGDSYFGGKVGVGLTSLSHELTVSGDINLTSDNDRMYYGSGGVQYYNGTCMIIEGSTSILEICD
jgi:hypothetical protein